MLSYLSRIAQQPKLFSKMLLCCPMPRRTNNTRRRRRQIASIGLKARHSLGRLAETGNAHEKCQKQRQKFQGSAMPPQTFVTAAN